MSVFGLQDVFAHAEELALPSGLRVRVPTTPGYVALKLRAWVDRSHDEPKDARDLASAVEWYCADPRIRKTLWDLVEDEVFLEYDSDTDLVAETPIHADWFTASSRDRHSLDEREKRIAALTSGFSEVADGSRPPET